MLVFESNSAVEETDNSSCFVVIFFDKTLEIRTGSNYELHKVTLDSSSQITHSNQQTYLSCSSKFALLPSSTHIDAETFTQFLGWTPTQKNKVKTTYTSLNYEDESPLWATTKKTNPSATSNHILELLISYSLKQNWKNGITAVIVGEKLAITIIIGGKLALSNVYPIANNDEVIYYIMLLIQTFELSQEETPVHIFGDCEATKTLATKIQNYLRLASSFYHQNITDARYSGLTQFLTQKP